ALLVRDRLPAILDVEDEPLAAAALVRQQDEIVRSSQVALLHTLLEDQVVRHLEPIEAIPYPADLLRVAPDAVDREARQIESVQRHLRRGRQRNRRQPELFHLGPYARRI